MTAFGIRGPGGSRTGSFVASPMSPLKLVLQGTALRYVTVPATTTPFYICVITTLSAEHARMPDLCGMLMGCEPLVSDGGGRRGLPDVGSACFHLSKAFRRAASNGVGIAGIRRVDRGLGPDPQVGHLDVAATVRGRHHP